MGWIIHSDADSFYASVELLFRPMLRDKPVVCGGDENLRHGIVLARNQLAKKFGIKTGVALVEARRYCPHLISVPPNYNLYLKYARLLREIYSEYSDRTEPFGLDESFVDLSPIAKTARDATMLSEEIRARVNKELGISVSVGVSTNKIYAKLGSDVNKPDGLTLISPDNYKEIVYRLPASDLLNVGPARSAILDNRYIRTIGDIVEAGPEKMGRILKSNAVGNMLYTFASGNDITPVALTGESIGMETIGNSNTFPRDLIDNGDVRMAFWVLAESVAARLRENGFEAGTVKIYLRSNDLSSFERQMKLERPTFISGELVDAAMYLFTKKYYWQRPLRSLGIRACELLPIGSAAQMSLFEDEVKRDKRIRLEYATDFIRNRYGYFSLQRGVLLEDRKLTSLDAKKDNIIHPVGYQYVS